MYDNGMVDKGAGHDDRAPASIIEHQHRTNVPNPGIEHEVNIPPIGTPARMQHARNSPRIRTENTHRKTAAPSTALPLKNNSSPEAGNLLIVLSDEHNPKVMGCAGHPEVKTPHLDALAASGTRFSQASCANPICVPTRAVLATGRPNCEIGYWDNVDAWEGKTPSWHHLLRERGHHVASIGKLHYRGWQGDDYGFSESLLPMHIHKGHGELKMLLRDPPGDLGDGSNLLNSAKAGESDYTR